MSNQEVRDGIRAALRELVSDSIDPETAADKVLGTTPKSQLAAYVRPLVLKEARGLARELSREVEHRAFGSGGGHATCDTETSLRPESDQATDDDHEAFVASGRTNGDYRRRLVATTFALLDGTLVPWGEATAAQHLERAAFQHQHAHQSTRDARRHEWAAATIEEYGVTCLNEIDALEIPEIP